MIFLQIISFHLPSSPRQRRIIVVEDEPVVGSLLKKLLRSEGIQVFVASSADEAIDTLCHLNGRVHLLITDMSLPEMSGLTLWEQVRTRFPDLRVLFISGERQLQVRPLVKKPFLVDELVSQVRQILGRDSL